MSVPVSSPGALIAEGERLHWALEAEAALRSFQRALALDSRHYGALWRAAAESIVVGMITDDGEIAAGHFEAAEAYARRAIEANPEGAEAREWLAVALGQRALSVGLRDRVRLAEEIRQAAIDAIALDSTSANGHHVLGQWHAEVMRVGGFRRFLARTMLGGESFGEASWASAERHLARSAELEPESLIHRIELARVHAATDREALARDGLRWVLAQPVRDPVDPKEKERAARLLEELR